MQTVEEALKEFHNAFGVIVSDEPVVPEGENELDWDAISDVWNLRMELVSEEYGEFREAMEAGHLVAIADAIADLIVVAAGTAVSFGIPLDRCFAEVHRSNMSKLGEDGKPIYREDGKVLKGPNFSPPNLREIIYGDQS